MSDPDLRRAFAQAKLWHAAHDSVGPLIDVSWAEHRRRHPRRNRITGSWRRMKNQAIETHQRLQPTVIDQLADLVR